MREDTNDTKPVVKTTTLSNEHRIIIDYKNGDLFFKNKNPFINKAENFILSFLEKNNQEKSNLGQSLLLMQEQENKYHIHYEFLYRIYNMITQYIVEAKETKSHVINKPKIRISCRKMLETLRHHQIELKTQELEEDKTYFDIESKSFICLNTRIKEDLLKKYIIELENELEILSKKFEEKISDPKIKITSNFNEYLVELDADMENYESILKEVFSKIQPIKYKIDEIIITYEPNRKKILNNILLQAETGNDINACKYLIEKGADIHFQKKNGESVLHLATEPSVIEWLLSQKADTELTDYRGFTPLHFHVLKENIAIVKLLIDAQANLNVKDKNGETPLYFAAKIRPNNELITILMNNGANIRAKNAKEHFAMSSPGSHKLDKHKKVSLCTEELLGLQAAEGAKAFKMIQKLLLQLENIENQLTNYNIMFINMQSTIKDLQNDNALLKKRLNLPQEDESNNALKETKDTLYNISLQ